MCLSKFLFAKFFGTYISLISLPIPALSKQLRKIMIKKVYDSSLKYPSPFFVSISLVCLTVPIKCQSSPPFSLIIFCKVMRWAMFKDPYLFGPYEVFWGVKTTLESHCLPNENFTSQRGFITDPTQAIIYWTTYFIKICFYAIFHHTHTHHPLLPINNRVNSSTSSQNSFSLR